MKRGNRDCRSRNGQSTSETLLLLPLYLMLVFGLLQMGQLATGLLVANYGAAAIARQMVRDGTTTLSGDYETKFKKLLVAGMSFDQLNAKRDSDTLLSNITVYACAKIKAFPFIGELLLKPALGSKYSDGGQCEDKSPSMGPFYFNGTPPYYFVVKGKATARMNYQP